MGTSDGKGSLLLNQVSASTFTTLSSFLWSNAGFGSLRNIKELDYYEPRYNPTVIPVAPESGIDASSTSNNVPAYRGTKVSAGRQLSVADYHAAFEAGKVTPTAVAKALLRLLTTNPKHKVAFLAIVEDQVLEAAERSTIRYKEGKALGPLDGIPMGVKGENSGLFSGRPENNLPNQRLHFPISFSLMKYSLAA